MAVRTVFEDEDCVSLLLETGFHKPLLSLTVADKPSICTTLKYYHAFVKVKAELDQFVEGLKALGVLELTRKHPDLMRPLFVDVIDCQKLTKGKGRLFSSSLSLANFTPLANKLLEVARECLRGKDVCKFCAFILTVCLLRLEFNLTNQAWNLQLVKLSLAIP